jgi:hypothetical protein
MGLVLVALLGIPWGLAVARRFALDETETETAVL